MTFHVMGGDRRQQYLAAYIAAKGFTVTTSYLDGEQPPDPDAQIVILPLPVSRDGKTLNAPLCRQPPTLEQVAGYCAGRRVFGGILPPSLAGTDYFAAEEITAANVIPTVEGALALAIENTPFTLWEQPVLVLGAGRIGRLLAQRLYGLGARVTVAARRPESLVQCRALGVEARYYEDVVYSRYRLVLNTVPTTVLDRARLERLPAGAVVMELASAPGGFDPRLAQQLGLVPLMARGLPGQYAPETAAALLGDYILKEMERLDGAL